VHLSGEANHARRALSRGWQPALSNEWERRTLARSENQGGCHALVDLLEGRKTEVESLVRPVKGFVSYSLVRTVDGGVSVTVWRIRWAPMKAVASPRNGSGKTRPTSA
jgi:hypothetical protein